MAQDIIDLIDVKTGLNALYMLYCTALLPLCVIGIAYFYAGLTQRRSSLTMFALPVWLVPFVFLDYFIWSYSLCYSSSSNRFIGNLDFTVLRNVRDNALLMYNTSRGDILVINHFLFNSLFKIICVGLTFPGCIAERGRILPMLVFLFFWSCMIYNPVTYWFWNANGWLSVNLDRLPVLDFAGGNCIHVVSGFTCLAYSYILGPRNPKLLYNYRNINTGYIVIGTFLVACGWIGFIGGCDYKFSEYSIYIFVNTILCACVSGIVWTAIDYYFSLIPLEGTELDDSLNEAKLSAIASHTSLAPQISQTGVLLNQHLHESKSNFVMRRKVSMISFSSGVMAGLVVITPAGGFVSSPTELWKSIVFGFVGAIIGNFSTRLKYFFRIDDALDIFAIHGVAGIVGSLMTGIFANDLYSSRGGWVKGHWIQLGYQALGCVVVSSYTFIMSCVFLYIIDLIPGLHLRIDKDFNKRIREQAEREKQQGNNNELESQLSPQDATRVDSTSEMSYLEKVELSGTDSYEFNGEYLMDFIEFIKIIRPQDYEGEEEGDDQFKNYNAIDNNIHGYGHDFELHSPDNQHLVKRE
ncbi:putative ammonium transporter [Scheffersomyces coipomensis]|uniref:putative ammonium transporter n=1 Tax=Scheffersomyces coipomensis TaxID=1788519 RepID=UPI00315CBE6A